MKYFTETKTDSVEIAAFLTNVTFVMGAADPGISINGRRGLKMM